MPAPSKNLELKKQKSEIFEIRDILKNELNKFSNISSTLKETSDELNNIDGKYNEYSKEIDESKTHITKLKRREFIENIFIYIAFVFYILCLVYVSLKRFPLHKIIFLVYSLLEMICGWLNLIGENLNLIYKSSIQNFNGTNVSDLLKVINHTALNLIKENIGKFEGNNTNSNSFKGEDL